MAISTNREQLEKGKFLESTSTAGQPAVAVCNPDGSNVGGSGDVTNAGTFAVQEDGASLTALQSIDGKITDCDTTDLALETGGNLATIAGDTTSIDGKTPSLGTAAMAGSVPVTIATDDTLKKAIVGASAPTVDSYATIAINLAAGADQVLVSSAANKQIWVYGYQFTVNAAGTVSFQDEDNTAITGIMPFGANGGASVAPSGNFAMPIWKLATDKDLEVDIVTSELDGWLTYAIISV